MRSLSPATLVFLLALGNISSPGEADVIRVGQEAPALSVDTWLKGDAVQDFEPGTVYVVEFWGTWCGPCIANIPHLTELQKLHEDDGLVVIGIATHEFEGIEPVREFMARRGNDMGYSVAYDGDLSMEHDWQTLGDPDVQFKMPEVFLVNAFGTITWTGHPDQRDEFHGAVRKALMARRSTP